MAYSEILNPQPVTAGLAITSAVTILQNAATVTGNGASLVVTGYGTTVLQITGIFVASIAFETSIDAGVSWVAISATQVGQGDIFNVATVPGIYRLTVAGLDLIRARVTWTSGTSITINGRSSNAINASRIIKLATSGLVIGALSNIGELRASNLAVTVTAATGVAATLTLPAVAAQFHYITSLDIRLYSTAARTGVAAPIVVTSTNLPGAIAFSFDTAGVIGTTIAQDFIGVTPVKSSTVNTATTIVAPLVTGGIWRITAVYFTGA